MGSRLVGIEIHLDNLMLHGLGMTLTAQCPIVRQGRNIVSLYSSRAAKTDRVEWIRRRSLGSLRGEGTTPVRGIG